jgi:rhodanese-related sulfurtransferase
MPISVKEMLEAARAAVPAVTPQEAKTLMDQGAVVIDVRDGTELAASGKVKGALAIPRGLLEFRADPAVPTHHPELRPDRTVILYCASGGRSALAGKTLKDFGYRDVRNLGAFKDWVAAGGETEPG